MLEYAKKGNLFRFMQTKEGQNLNREQRIEIFRQIVEAVNYLH